MDKYEIIQEIHNEGIETDIIDYLISWLKDENEKLYQDSRENRSVINAVRKINAAKQKPNKAIMVLCE